MKIRKVIRVNVLNIVVWAVFFIIWAAGMSSNVYWSVTRQLLTMIFMTFGLMIQMISGVLDLSFAAEISASTCIGACLLRTGMPLAPAMAAVLVCHLGLGALKGFLVASLRVNPVIITLALQIIVSNLSGLFTGDHMVIFNRKDVYASHAFWLSLFVLAVVSSLFFVLFSQKNLLWKISSDAGRKSGSCQGERTESYGYPDDNQYGGLGFLWNCGHDSAIYHFIGQLI